MSMWLCPLVMAPSLFSLGQLEALRICSELVPCAIITQFETTLEYNNNIFKILNNEYPALPQWSPIQLTDILY